MNDQILLLASKMLDVASDKFSNHGCNDLDKDVLEVITDEKTLCDDIRIWNGDTEDPWPESVSSVGDSSLMAYLSWKLKGSID